MEDKINNYLENLNEKTYTEYLENYKKVVEDVSKCNRSKKCLFTFKTTKNEIIKKKGDDIIYKIKLPKYTLVSERISKLKDEMKECSEQIKLMQNKINIDSNKKMIEKYKTLRKKYIELEDEGNELTLYLDKVNNIEEIEKKKVELTNELNKKEQEKRLLYQEICLYRENKESKKFKNSNYNSLIQKYLDNKEINKIKLELKKVCNYQLLSDKLFYNIDRDESIGKVDYLIKELPEVKHNKKKSGKSIKIKK